MCEGRQQHTVPVRHDSPSGRGHAQLEAADTRMRQGDRKARGTAPFRLRDGLIRVKRAG